MNSIIDIFKVTYFWALLLTMIFIATTGTSAPESDKEKCNQALLIWHTSRGEDVSFFQGRRFLIHFIDGLLHCTDVIVTTTGTNANMHIQFQKETANNTWMEPISLYKPRYSGNHVISSNEISETVFKYMDQNNTPKRAEEVFLIVTNKSMIDNEGRVKEALRKKKTFVVVYGKQTDRNVWTDLATDNYHFKELQNTNSSLNSITKSLLTLSYKDSSLLCDTDQYWTGERCYRCSYICTSSPSEYCLKECPYLNHLVQDADSVRVQDADSVRVQDADCVPVNKTAVNDCNYKDTIIILLIIIICLILVPNFLFCWVNRESIMMLFRNGKSEKIQTNNHTTNESVLLQDSKVNEIDGNSQEETDVGKGGSTSNNTLLQADNDEKKIKSYYFWAKKPKKHMPSRYQ